MSKNVKKYLKTLESKRSNAEKKLSILNKEKKLLKKELNTLRSMQIFNESSMTLIRNIECLDAEFLENFYVMKAKIKLTKHWHRDDWFDFSYDSLIISDDEYEKLDDNVEFIRKLNEQVWGRKNNLILSDDSGLDGFEDGDLIYDLMQNIFHVNEITFSEKKFIVYLLLDKEGVKKYKKLNEKKKK